MHIKFISEFLEKKGPVPVNESEIGELINVLRLKDDLQKGLDQLKSDYMKNLSLRSASGKIACIHCEWRSLNMYQSS